MDDINFKNLILNSKDIKKLKKPNQIQGYINSLEYNSGKRISILDVFNFKKGDCLESACFASFILTNLNIENFIIDLSSVRDEDHVLCVFKENNLFGAIAQSKYLGLRYRNPVYKNLRELAISYFENYFNYFGELTLRAYSKPIKLKFTLQNIQDVNFVIDIENKLNEIKHVQLINKNFKFPLVSKIKFDREILIKLKNTRIGKKYL
jgi:hypothetical protein